MRLRRPGVIALGLVLWLAPAPGAQPPPASTAEGTLSFAHALLREGDSFRAATEYMRFLHHYPAHPDTAAALEGLGRAYAAANRFDEAGGIFRRLLGQEGADPGEARWLLGGALYKAENYSLAAGLLLGAGAEGAGEGSRLLGTLAHLREAPEEELPPLGLDDVAREYRQLPRKSPGTAGFLSAVLPGAGHFYCGRPRDGTISLLLNGVFLWGIYESVQRENYPLAAILGFFELGWYSGNIVSSVNAAHKWNRREQGRFFRRWEEAALPRWRLALGSGAAGGALSWRW